MLDEFVWGKEVGRISPEAPVPVVEVSRGNRFILGCDQHVARNLREFTSVAVVGAIGRDRGGDRLSGNYWPTKDRYFRLFRRSGFSTIVKTRIIARQRSVPGRPGQGFWHRTERQIDSVVACVKKMLPEIDGIIFSKIMERVSRGKLVSGIVAPAPRPEKDHAQLIDPGITFRGAGNRW